MPLPDYCAAEFRYYYAVIIFAFITADFRYFAIFADYILLH